MGQRRHPLRGPDPVTRLPPPAPPCRRHHSGRPLPPGSVSRGSALTRLFSAEGEGFRVPVLRRLLMLVRVTIGHVSRVTAGVTGAAFGCSPELVHGAVA